ncbi:MAG: hypothetical protein GXO10_03035 [Crenarchaeota archaeon]|nr:hypothetical protein [Thermoproteota archaeon]
MPSGSGQERGERKLYRMLNIFEKIRTYLRTAEAVPQLRRYITLGMFDGIVVALAAIIAVDLKNLSSSILWTSGLSSLLGVALASAWNTVQAELLERASEIRRIERTILRPLKGTMLEKAYKVSIVICTIAHSLSPLTGLLLILLYLTLRSIVPGTALPLTMLSGSIVLGLLGLMYKNELERKDLVKLCMLMSSVTVGLVIVLALVLGH